MPGFRRPDPAPPVARPRKGRKVLRGNVNVGCPAVAIRYCCCCCCAWSICCCRRAPASPPPPPMAMPGPPTAPPPPPRVGKSLDRSNDDAPLPRPPGPAACGAALPPEPPDSLRFKPPLENRSSPAPDGAPPADWPPNILCSNWSLIFAPEDTDLPRLCQGRPICVLRLDSAGRGCRKGVQHHREVKAVKVTIGAENGRESTAYT